MAKDLRESCSLHIFTHSRWNNNQLNVCHSQCKFSACASHLLSVTLCLIFVVWPCIDDLYILNVSGQKLARKLQFAYFHPVSVKSQSLKRLPHSKLSACGCYLFSVTLCLMCCLAVHRWFIYFECKWPKTCANLHFAYLHIRRSATLVTVKPFVH